MTYIIQFLLAMIISLAFGTLFSSPRRELPFCGISGAIGWIVYYLITERSGNTVVACLVATFILTVFSRTMAVLRESPATIYLLSGIFPFVPGAGIYYTVYYLITGEKALFAAKGLETFELAFAIVFGIIFGFAIPQALFHKLAPKKKQ
ncbi:MAG: threonine/serine exporter family protein [Roseburia sp.]